MVSRVLVVDDDSALLRMVRLSLQTSGFEVSTATSGIEALDSVRTATPNAVVLDLDMPMMDGRAFYREMRANGCDVPVLILSAHGAKQGKAELDADGFLNKPFDPGELATVLEELIANDLAERV